MLLALLIDDEVGARADLRGKLAAHPEVTVVGEAATFRAARALLASADYDVVFLDIQLMGGESLALVPDVRAGASIIFATAHERYAARTFECNAIDFLLKPIEPARLMEALRRAAIAHAAHLARTGRAAHDATAPAAARAGMLARLAVGSATAAPHLSHEVALTGDERVYLRQCLEAWEDALPPLHVLHAQLAPIAALPRTVHYQRNMEPTRLFLVRAPVSRVRRWWRAVRAAFGS